MKGNWIITVGRQFCSGGAEIGQKVAKIFDIPYYDKMIIDHTAEKLNIDDSIVKKHDEKPLGIFDIPGYQYGYSLYAPDPSLMLPLNMKIAETQFQTIREYAKNGPCVIVGRCADHVLRNNRYAINFFIRADMEKRVARAMRLYGLCSDDAKKLIKKTDRIRASYYSGHTHNEWGSSDTYNMILDSGVFGIDGCVKIITGAVELLEETKEK